MIASLPMYDRPSTKEANDRFWQAIRDNLRRGPARLDRDTDPHDTWLRPDLVLSQTCGLPYRSELHGRVQLVGTPDYGVEGCAPGYYCSCIVVRKDDERETLAAFATARLARNDPRSQSGWAALVAEFGTTAQQVLRKMSVLDTGSHAASAQAVVDGMADLAAIDAVTWALLRRDAEETSRLRVLARTAPTPGLPYITSLQDSAPEVRHAVDAAIEYLSETDRQTLLLNGLISIPAAEYLRLPLP